MRAPLAAPLPPRPNSETVALTDRSGDYAVLIDHLSDDHIVVRRTVDQRGREIEIILGYDTWAWDRAVARAQTALVFR